MRYAEEIDKKNTKLRQLKDKLTQEQQEKEQALFEEIER
jgi:hypothetical protein